MKKLLWILIIIAIIVAAIFWLWPKSKPVPAMTATIKKGSITESVVATGQIVPVQAIQVKSQVPGNVGKVLVVEG